MNQNPTVRTFLIHPMILWIAVISTVSLMINACHTDQSNGVSTNEQQRLDSVAKREFLKYFTLSIESREADADTLLKAYERTEGYRDNIYYWITKVGKLNYGFKNDTLVKIVEAIDIPKSKPEEWVLQQLILLKSKSNDRDLNPSAVLKQLIEARSEAEKLNSIFIYELDNLLAMSYYVNGDTENSLKHVELLKRNYPYPHHPRFRQMYYDIRFMLSLNYNDKVKTKEFLDSCQSLAIALNDTLALMRSYDFEAQWLKRTGRTQEAIEKARVYFQFANETKRYNAIKRYLNFAELFLANGQPDSAIFYLNQGVKLDSIQKNNTKDLAGTYLVYSASYAMKGDFKRAFDYSKKENEAFKEATELIQKTEIAELTARYDAERKDEAIQSLQTNNELNDKLILQQRWTFSISIALLALLGFFLFNFYKQKLFKARHDKLLLENKQLLLEQKNRQNQLNPHFIYNSIANLQGLISTNQKQEANQYLITLTRVIRDMLELNRKDFIPLEKEIKSLQNYVNLQQMRFSHSFDFKVDSTDLDIDNILIPPMLIQPFVENAIEHGLMNLDRQGCLQVKFYQDDRTLHIEITDNGKGATEESVKNFEKESLSHIITQERIELLYGKDIKTAGLKTFPNFRTDGSGYKVEIYIPLTLFFD